MKNNRLLEMSVDTLSGRIAEDSLPEFTELPDNDDIHF
jgi:hypothetical protein